MSSVLVLNAGYEPLHRVSVRHAIGMLIREVAVIEEAADDREFGPFPYPVVLRLVRYVAMKWRRRGPARCTKAGVRARDGRCAYCGGPAETVDHIVPASRGGELTWLNAVAACRSCNLRKADRTPAEAGMTLELTPYEPMGIGYTPAWAVLTA